jgi:hypothetical protein
MRKMSAKERSPKYPSIGLTEAFELIKKLWIKEKRTAVPPAVVSVAWGYKGPSGPVRSKIGSLKQYGLLERESGGTIALSDLAIEIVAHQDGSREQVIALQRAARNPQIFEQIYSTMRDASDHALKANLITKGGFSDASARQVIRAYRDTIAFAKLTGEPYIEEAPPNKLAIGDYVQWEANGEFKFDKPRKVTGFYDKSHAKVEGTQTGVPIAELTKVDPDGEESEYEEDETHEIRRSRPGMNQANLPLDEGNVTLQWPKQLSRSSFGDLKDWLEIMLRKAERAVVEDSDEGE